VSRTALLDSIAFVSWNTRVGGADIERFLRDLRAGRFTNGDSVHHFVLLLQEVYRSGELVPERVQIDVPDRIAINPPGLSVRRDIVKTASTLGLALVYVPSMRNGLEASGSLREDRGNAILSTLEFSSLRALDLPHEVQRRVAVLAEITIMDARGHQAGLTLASVHLDTRSRILRLYASAGTGRLRQARALIHETSEVGAIVLGGDFNTWGPRSLEHALPELRAAFPDTPALPGQPTFETFGIERRLDYFFFRLPPGWQPTYRRIDLRYGSDHYPLLAFIRTR
jgi:endonuclease/exonuclease/phosphatase family metal-dependent hydrolase